MSASNPKAMTVSRPGRAVRSPEGVATAPFWVEMLLEGSADGENTAMRATLDPGTITRWHTHPRGQLLYVLSGHGLAQSEGGPVAELRAGDAVWFAAGERTARPGRLTVMAFGFEALIVGLLPPAAASRGRSSGRCRCRRTSLPGRWC